MVVRDGRVCLEVETTPEQREMTGVWKVKCLEVGPDFMRLLPQDGQMCYLRLGQDVFYGSAQMYAAQVYIGRWLRIDFDHARMDVLRHPTGFDEHPWPDETMAGGGGEQSLIFCVDPFGYKKWVLCPPPRRHGRVGR